MSSITSANSIFIITVPGLYGSGVQLQGYAADKAFATEALEVAEVKMGVDGIMTAGYVPNPVKQKITLQADSQSKEIFSTILAAMQQTRDIYWMAGVITLPATGETFSLSQGVLTSLHPVPDAEKVLAPQEYEITWQSVQRALL
jgi:hypothetical protein